jgi:hypothetical protein
MRLLCLTPSSIPKAWHYGSNNMAGAFDVGCGCGVTGTVKKRMKPQRRKNSTKLKQKKMLEVARKMDGLAKKLANGTRRRSSGTFAIAI